MVTDNVDLDIEAIAGDGERAIAAAVVDRRPWPQVETELLGKRSALTRAHRTLGGLDPEARKEAGRRLNEVRSPARGPAGGAPRASWPRPSAPRRSGPTASTSPRSSRTRCSRPRRGATCTS